MTKLLEQAVEAVRGLPPKAQDALARMLMEWTCDQDAPLDLTSEESASLAVSQAQARRGEFAADEEIRAIWAKRGL